MKKVEGSETTGICLGPPPLLITEERKGTLVSVKNISNY